MEISERDYDLLVDTQIVVDVMLGSTNITIKEFLDLAAGDILSLKRVSDTDTGSIAISFLYHVKMNDCNIKTLFLDELFKEAEGVLNASEDDS